MMHTVLLVDDHPLFLGGLCRAIDAAPDLQVVGTAASAAEAFALEESLRPDVVVTDVNLGVGEADGLDLVARLRTARPALGIVVLTMYEEDELLLRALRTGASGFCRKTSGAEELIALVRHAVAAPLSFSARGLAEALTRAQRHDQARPALTAREQQVLERLATGSPLPVIARELYVSTSTVKTYVARVYEKLGATSRTEAVVSGVRHGLIRLEKAPTI